VLGERDRVAALRGDAPDLGRAQLGLPQHGQRHRDEPARIRAAPLVDVPVVVRLHGRERELLVVAREEQPPGEGRERREAHARASVSAKIAYRFDEEVRDMPGALHGVRVLDLSWGIAGPLGVLLLAEQGADVIKVEPPGGDPFRDYSGYAVWNRSRRSVTVDLK